MAKAPKEKPSNASDLTFFNSLFASIAEEMGATLVRTAHSPNIKERRDCSCALFDGRGRLIAQAAHIPVHLGAMPRSVRAALDAFGDMGPEDAILLNDPYAGGTHLPDLTIVSPVFAGSTHGRKKSRPVAFLASRAHHADVGGMTPGSLPLSTEIQQEGLRLPPVRLKQSGRLNHSVRDILLANTRTPREREGDLLAQLAAHDVGALRLQEVLQRYGAQEIANHMQALLRYGKRLMGALIARIPDGTYNYEDLLDDDGAGTENIKIKATVRIDGRRATVDFSRSDPACRGNLNAVEAITCSAVYYCFLSLLVSAPPGPLTAPSFRVVGASQYDPPLNAGCFEPIEVIALRGTVVNAMPPHAVACGNLETAQRIVDVVLGALSKALPELIPAASQGTMNNLTIGGIDPSNQKPFAYYETIAGGMGARPGANGSDAVQVHMTNTMNTPVEALEFSCPMRVERYEIIPNSGGRGRFRGGHGVRRDVRMLCNATGTLLCERRQHAPYGLNGGKQGRVGRNTLIRAGRSSRLPAKTHLELQPGDIISVQTPGGGGWGEEAGENMEKSKRRKGGNQRHP